MRAWYVEYGVGYRAALCRAVPRRLGVAIPFPYHYSHHAAGGMLLRNTRWNTSARKPIPGAPEAARQECVSSLHSSPGGCATVASPAVLELEEGRPEPGWLQAGGWRRGFLEKNKRHAAA